MAMDALHAEEVDVMTEAERWAWVAGIFEGEGTIIIQRHRPDCASLQVHMADEDIVRRCHSVTGVGNVYGPYRRGKDHFKPQWHWMVQARSEVVMVLEAIRPWLGARRGARADEVLALHEAIPLAERRKLEGHPHIVEAPPGTTAYRHGCRCDECRAANARGGKERSRRFREVQMLRNGEGCRH